MTKSGYGKPGIPIDRAFYTDMRGQLIWEANPYLLNRMYSLGDHLVYQSIPYAVRRVAVSEGVMYVNLERVW